MVSNPIFFRSMRARMTLAFVLLTALLMLLMSGGILGSLRYSALRTTDTTLDMTVMRVKNELGENPNGAGFNDFLADNGDSLKMEGLALVLLDSQGRVLQKSQFAAPSWPHHPEDGWLIRTLPDGPRTIMIGSYWRKTEAALAREAGMLLGLSLCVIVASGFGAWWLVGRTLGPLSAVSQQARRAAKTESLHHSLTLPSDDAEMVELVDTLNSLLTHIGETAETKGRFYAAASHELRTPLQALSGHLELALSRERSREEYRAATEEASRQTQRLSALVQGLLLLNQLDRPRSNALPRATVDLTEICRTLMTQFFPLIEERRLKIVTELAPTAEIAAFPQHAEMFVRNLIENALKYATESGLVRLLLEADDGISLKLFNTFPSELRLDTDALFEPFYRPDEARASGTGGNGLGLAISRAIAGANGWKIHLEQVESGVWVTVDFSSSC